MATIQIHKQAHKQKNVGSHGPFSQDSINIMSQYS